MGPPHNPNTPSGGDDDSLFINNVTPDSGLSAPFNTWMTLFGQFFDHGLDLIAKGGSGTIFIPLQPDDPLYVAGSPTNFMVLTRATNLPGADGIIGTADDIHDATNIVTPLVDQSSDADLAAGCRRQAVGQCPDWAPFGYFQLDQQPAALLPSGVTPRDLPVDRGWSAPSVAMI